MKFNKDTNIISTILYCVTYIASIVMCFKWCEKLYKKYELDD